jgi:hypothetical protein
MDRVIKKFYFKIKFHCKMRIKGCEEILNFENY